MTNNSRLVDKKSLDTFAKAIYSVIMSDITTKLNNKADKNHNHNTLYYTKSEIDNSLDSINTEINNIKQKNPVTLYVDDNNDVWVDW